jgi:INO80 complex subunit C
MVVSELADTNIEAGPSVLPGKKLCDISGFVAPYTDPRTKLRYCDSTMYHVIRTLSDDDVHRYLALRNAHTVLK